MSFPYSYFYTLLFHKLSHIGEKIIMSFCMVTFIHCCSTHRRENYNVISIWLLLYTVVPHTGEKLQCHLYIVTLQYLIEYKNKAFQ